MNVQNLFINYNSHQRKPSQLSKNEHHAIQSFVSARHRRKARPIARPSKLALQWSRKAPPEVRTHDSSSKSNVDQIDRRTAHKEGTSIAKDDLASQAVVDYNVLLDTTINKTALYRLTKHEPYADLFLRAGSADPFSTSPLVCQKCEPLGLDHLFRYWAPCKGRILGDADVYRKQMFPLALESPALFYSLLAVSQSNLQAKYAKPAPNKVVLYYRGQALKLFGERVNSLTVTGFEKVSSPERDTLIWTAIMLLSMDYLYKDFASFKTQLAGIELMVKLSGGLQNQGLLPMLVAYLKSMRLMLTKSPGGVRGKNFFEHFDGDFFELSLHGVAPVIQDIPVGFRMLIDTGNLLPATSQKIGKLAGEPGAFPRNVKLTKDMHTYFDENPGSLDECLCTGLVIYYLAAYDEKRGYFYSNLLEALSHAVVKFDSRDPLERECFFWVLTVAGSVERTHKPWQHRFPFVRFMLEQFPETRNHAYWLDVLHKFFWDDSLALDWEAAWAAGMEDVNARNNEPLVILKGNICDCGSEIRNRNVVNGPSPAASLLRRFGPGLPVTPGSHCAHVCAFNQEQNKLLGHSPAELLFGSV